MQKRKKQLLGIGGLAVVVASTVYAVTIPSPDVNAASTGGGVNLKVQVYSGHPEADINTIADGEVVISNEIYIGGTYSDADKVTFELYKKTADGPVYVDLGADAEYIPANPPENGERVFPFDLNSSEDLGYGEYVLRMVVESNGSIVESIVSFRYAPLKLTVVGTAENGDPIVDVGYDANVSSVDLNAYDSANNSLFGEALSYPVENPGAPGTIRITLPFLDYGASSGDYLISAIAKNTEGAIIDPNAGPVYAPFTYKSPDSPEVPKTGDITKKLNMSRTDFLVTGLIGFGLFTVLALYLLRKQRR